MAFFNTRVSKGITIQNANYSLVGGDKSVRTQGADSLDVQSRRDTAVFDHLYWTGSITSFEDVGGGNIKAYYVGTIELSNGNSVVISSTANYNDTYTISNVITDVEDSFEFTATWVATETGAWTAEPLYDRLSPGTNKNDNTWSLESQTSFFAEAENSITIGKRNKALVGWGGDWSAGLWGTCIGYQNIMGGKGTTVVGNNNIAENYWCAILGDHNHVSEWSTRVLGNWNVGQGGDGLLVGSFNDTYGWRGVAVGEYNFVAGNESQAWGNYNTIYDAHGSILNEQPDALHNRYNIALGQSNIIGSADDLGDLSTGSITAFADAGDNYHVRVTSVGHGLVDWDVITITGTTSYDGKYSVDHVTSDTFDIHATWVANDATGSWSQNYTVNNAIAIGSNNTVAVDGGVAIGKNLVNLFENSIELGASNTSKIAVRSDGRFVFPSPLEGGTAPTLAEIPVGHATMWYDPEAPEKLWVYRNNNSVLQKCQIGSTFVSA